MMRSLLVAMPAAVYLAAAALGLTSAPAAAGPLTGLRVVKVTDRVDATGVKAVHTFTIMPGDRVYVTRTEAEVIHPDGTSDEAVFDGRFGNLTVSRVQP